MTRTVAALLAFLIASNGIAKEELSQVFSSADRDVALVELYTSEGCSSCPPADRWLSQLRSDSGLWRDFVPVAFHVDYWDYLGWPDRFADVRYSARQRSYYNQGAVRTVYTPGMFVGGREWTGWRRSDEPDLRRNAAAGVLTATVRGNRVTVDYKADDADAESLVAHVALLGMGLTSDVRRGENRGRQLSHDFVVLGAASGRLIAADEQAAADFSLPVSGHSAERYALAVWVSTPDAQRPLQATGGYLSP